MEVEEGYMALHFQPRKEQKSHEPTPKMKEASWNSRCHWIAHWIGWAGNVILVVAVIMLVFQMRRLEDDLRSTKEAENKSILSHLRQVLCKPLNNSMAENSSCRLCPQNWSLHVNKCYWISKEKRTWHKSEKDCKAKQSQMLVIQNQQEIAFIQSITEGAQLLWIGLQATFPEKKWTWIDDSPLDDKLFQALGPAGANLCGRLNGKQIISEACGTITTWICETEAFLI